MNILFIEDEKELAVTGVAQLELRGYTVFPAYDIAEAQAILDDPECSVHFVITDHRLPDGLGIQFVIDMRESFPRSKCAVVSGCLTSRDIEKLEAHKIPYYHKPLLYGKVIDDLRRMHASNATDYVEPASEPEVVEAVEETPRKSFKIWPFKSAK
ncbi:hypothetical protein ACWPKO_01070 [Coraliomargarita sp. W4R53]